MRERFGLVAHLEKKNLPVYLLKVARRESDLKIRRSTLDCTDLNIATKALQEGLSASNGAPQCSAVERPGAFIAGGMTMDALAKALRIPAGRTVINETGIPGSWEFDLQFTTPEDSASDKPSVFTAVQEMGLRLESSSLLRWTWW